MSRKSNACRFFIHNIPAKTRSSEWRVWAQGEDVYIAPSRIAGEFKLSIHRDGMNQLGYYGTIRDEIRAADKHYLRRWKRDPAPFPVDGWTALCGLFFDPQEFESVPFVEDARRPVQIMNTPADGLSACVFVLATDNRDEAGELSMSIIGELPRGSSGSVAIVGIPLPRDPKLLAAVDADNHGFGWHAPAKRGFDEPFGFVCGIGTFPMFAEYSTVKHNSPPLVPHLSGFRGSIAVWSDAPMEFVSAEVFCAVLACDATSATMYVDDRAHCGHGHLVGDANDLIEAFHTGKIDAGWTRISDGRLATGITMRATADAAGITEQFGNPLKNSGGAGPGR